VVFPTLVLKVGFSGYFGVTSLRFNLYRILTLFVQVRFYAWLGFQIGTSLGWVKLGYWYVFYMYYIPVANGMYWYASAYLFLALLAPGLNSMARVLSRIQYLIVILLLLFIEVDNCRGSRDGRHYVVLDLRNGKSAPHLAIIYFIAGYLRLHSRIFPRFFYWIAYYYTFKCQYHLLQSTQRLRSWLHNHYLGIFSCHFMITRPNQEPANLVNIVLTMLTIAIVEGIRLGGPIGKSFSFLGSLSFSVYLIHNHPVWGEVIPLWWFRAPEMISTPAMASVNQYRFTITVFVFCIIVDIYRHYFWENLADVVSGRWGAIKGFVLAIPRPTCRRARQQELAPQTGFDLHVRNRRLIGSEM
jgi:hypothetical protein